MIKSKTYRDEIEKAIISDFIKKNSRAPEERELNELRMQSFRKMNSIETIGFTGSLSENILFKDYSQSELEKEKQEAICRDIECIDAELSSLLNGLEGSASIMNQAFSEVGRQLKALEAKADSLVLCNSKADVFIHSIEESFDDHESIDLNDTTALFETGFVTMPLNTYKSIKAKPIIKYSVSTPNGILSSSFEDNIEDIIRENGEHWIGRVYTNYQSGVVSLIIDIDFSEEIDMNFIGLESLATGSERETILSAFVGKRQGSMVTLEPYAQVMKKNNFFIFEAGKIQKIRLTLEKSVADSFNPKTRQYCYEFCISHISFKKNDYSEVTKCELYCGPYYLTDVNGREIKFSQGTIEACTIEPSGTSVSFYLSNDEENWQYVSHKSDSIQVAIFGNYAKGDSSERVDEEKSYTEILDVPGYDQVHRTDAILNEKISQEFKYKVPVSSIKIKRNIVGQFSDENVLDAEQGWIYDPITKRYRTTAFISNEEGRLLDFGAKGIYINGILNSNRVLLPQGYTSVEVADTNWLPVGEHTSLSSLLREDSLYPYNHKLIIEGYPYPKGFVGNQIYHGVDEYFGSEMKYISPDYFDFIGKDHPDYWKIFTIYEENDAQIFKVKVNKSDPSWIKEEFEISWIVQNNGTGNLWVKAILECSSETDKPIIESFKVRVI